MTDRQLADLRKCKKVMGDTKPKPFVFVLIPFSEEFADVYEVGIKAACKDAGAYCERVDEQIFTESILERVYKQIAKAGLIVADMTGRNPNVFYETGYAHALNKQVILLTQHVDDIPFDLKHYPHIVYAGKIALLKTMLESRIRRCLENPGGSLADAEVNVRLLIDYKEIVDNPHIRITVRDVSSYIVSRSPRPVFVGRFKISIHNVGKKTLRPGYFNVALLTPPRLNSAESLDVDFKPYSYSVLSNTRRIYNIQLTDPVFPDSRSTFDIDCFIYDTGSVGIPLEMSLRLFTELGSRDFQFILEFQKRESKA